MTRKGASAVGLSPLLLGHDLGQTPNRGRVVGKDEDGLGLARPVGYLRTVTEVVGRRSDVVDHHLPEGGHRQDEDHLFGEGRYFDT